MYKLLATSRYIKEIKEILKSEMEEHNPCMEPINDILEKFSK